MVNKNYLGAHKDAVPISMVIDGTKRYITLAAIGDDVYEFVPQGHSTVPPTFNRVNDLKTFIKQTRLEISKRKRKK
jgi:hypothetical protein